ncbi:MAG: YicC/YloC family endoribonuclease [Bacteroidota bacterium]|nr:YicC/YloC family endoribonuclease [Bacteroidota bacterium]
MLLSMTGFGKAECILSNKKISVEIKTLNSKHFDANVRIPSVYKSKEVGIRQQLNLALNRGKIDCSLFIEKMEGEPSVKLDKKVITAYYTSLKSIAEQLGNTDELMSSVMRLPHVILTEKDEFEEDEWKEITKAIDQAIKAVNDYRLKEGNQLKLDFEQRIKTISTLLQSVEQIGKKRTKRIQLSIANQIKDLKLSVDENRFEQEMIYYLEKLDVTEEIIRLGIHLNYFSDVMNESNSQGKKLGFIGQEIGREINTIGSKANDADMQKLVVQMKDELEKIKEQLLNVL